MSSEEIKKELAHLPHVKKAYLKDGKIYIHPLKGAKEINLIEISNEKSIKIKKDGIK